ncbi:MAG TPA: hypothetical protein VES39_01985, partial [Rhodospirillales bacterium]|nr:hypothetical protein [Rhodospirillales bacterium]
MNRPATEAAGRGNDAQHGAVLLFEYLRRVSIARRGRRAVRVVLSLLRPSVSHDRQMRLAINALAALQQSLRAELFPLPDGDILLFYESEAHGLVESAVVKLYRRLVDDLPFDIRREPKPLAIWYDIEHDFEAVEALIIAAYPKPPGTAAGRSPAAATSVPVAAKRQSLTPERVARLQEGLAQTDLSSFVRGHHVCRIAPDAAPRLL